MSDDRYEFAESPHGRRVHQIVRENLAAPQEVLVRAVTAYCADHGINVETQYFEGDLEGFRFGDEYLDLHGGGEGPCWIDDEAECDLDGAIETALAPGQDAVKN